MRAEEALRLGAVPVVVEGAEHDAPIHDAWGTDAQRDHREHAPHLAVFAFGNFEFQPLRRYVPALSNRWLTRP